MSSTNALLRRTVNPDALVDAILDDIVAEHEGLDPVEVSHLDFNTGRDTYVPSHINVSALMPYDRIA